MKRTDSTTLFRFIEEPTAPDDALGHAAIRKGLKPYGIGVATGEHAHNRMTFKQLLQAEAIDVCQIDSCRLGGVSEVLAVLLMSAKFGVPVCPHAGGVGLCEYVVSPRSLPNAVESTMLSAVVSSRFICRSSTTFACLATWTETYWNLSSM